MSAQITRRVQRGLLFVLLLMGSLACAALAADRPKSKDDLDPESRQKFEQLRDELRKASQEIEDAKKRACEEHPLLLKAKGGIERSRELENAAGKEKKKVDQFLASKPKEVRSQYRNWQRCYGEALDHDLLKTASQDPKLGPLYPYFAKSMLEELRQRKSKALDSIRNEIPQDEAKITPEQAMPLYLRMLENSKAENAPKLAELEKQLSPPEFMRDYVKTKSNADGLFLVCDTYFRLNMPEYVAQAEKESKKTANELIPQLDKIWPGWAEAEMRDSELLRSQKAMKEGAGRTSSSLRVVFPLAALVILVGVFVYRQARRESKQGVETGTQLVVASQLADTSCVPVSIPHPIAIRGAQSSHLLDSRNPIRKTEGHRRGAETLREVKPFFQARIPMSTTIRRAAAVLATALSLASAATGAETPGKPAKNYTVAVYWWPNFHHDAFHQAKKWEGWTEWEIVKSAKPLFPGHDQPKVPLWGYRDESDPKEMARSIDALADAGVGAIIFDWYRYDDNINGGMMIEKALRDGFLQAPNRGRIQFALMWANETYIDCHPLAPGKNFNNAPVWRKGELSRAAFERHTNDAIENYFSRPNYWKIDGKPYFSIYKLDVLIKGFGGIEATRTALDGFRDRVKAAGFPGLHLNIVDFLGPSLHMVKGQPMPGDKSRKVETLKDLLESLGADSSTWYTWVHHVNPAGKAPPKETEAKETGAIAGPLPAELLRGNAQKAGVATRDYLDWGNEALRIQAGRGAALGVPLFPHVARGWDGSPRNYSSGIVVGNTPERFRHFLAEAKALADKHPECKGIVTINSWNEWVEGSYLEPDTVDGMKYLDAIRAVFGGRKDYTPSGRD